MKYCYAFYEVRKTDPMSVDYATLRRAEFEICDQAELDRIGDGLRPWAIGIITRNRYEVGLYFAEFGPQDEEGYPTREVRATYIPWSGSAKIVDGKA